MNRLLTSMVMATVFCGHCLADRTMQYTFVGDAPMVNYNTYRSETVSLAIKMDNPLLAGKKITSLKAKINLEGQEVTDCSLWLSSSLTVEKGDDGKKHNVADIVSLNVVPDQEGWLEATLPEPYALDGKALYAGYTFTIPSYNNEAKSPIVYSQSRHAGGFYYFSPTSAVKWMDYESNLKGVLPVYVEVEGEFHPASVGITGWDTQAPYAQTGTEFYLPLSIMNMGTDAVETMEYSYSCGSYSGKGTYVSPTPVAPDIVDPTAVSLAFDPSSLSGSQTMRLSIEKVNGIENNCASMTMDLPVEFRDLVPVQRTVLEEATGTWCSACPRGMMAIRRLTESYGDRFIAVAYHGGADPMKIADEAPFDVPHYPSAVLDRGSVIDPYYGATTVQNPKNFDIVPLVDSALRTPASAAVDVSSEWDPDTEGFIRCEAGIAFVDGLDKEGYNVSFILVANGLRGDDRIWWQVNSNAGGDPDYLGPVLAPLAEMGNPITDMAYDDVAILAPSSATVPVGAGLAPAEFRTYACSLDTKDAVSDYELTKGMSLVQDGAELEVVALLLSPSGKVVNADKTKVKGSASTPEITEKAIPVSTRFYDLAGRPMSEAGKGMTIQVETLSDGSRRATRLVAK